MRDPYSILGVQRDAGAEEIKAAWRAKAKSSHPDQNREDPTATQRFAEIGQAYDLLKDPSKRSRYDQQRSKMDAMKREQTIMQQREEARAAAERARQAKANAERVMAELARIEAEKAKAEKAAEVLNTKVEAARARAKSAEAQAADASADATKAQASTRPASASASPSARPDPTKTAPESNGQAQSQAQAQNQSQPQNQPQAQPAGPDAAEDAAAKIFAAQEARREEEHADEGNRSRGFAIPVLGLISSLVRRIRKPAPVLEKAPDIMVEATIAIDDLLQQNIITVQLSDGREVRVWLEPGHTDGSIARLSGKGLKVPNMQTGDVLVTLRVLKSPTFSVDGYDIHCVAPVKLEDAVLGCETTIEGPRGPLTFTVPAWTGSDQSIRIEGEGLPSGPDECGALVVEIRVVLWEKPDEKVTDLMKVMKHGLFL